MARSTILSMGFITADPENDRRQMILPPVRSYERTGSLVTERSPSFSEAIQLKFLRLVIAFVVATASVVIFTVIVPFGFLLSWAFGPVVFVTLVLIALFSGTTLREAECPACHLTTRVGQIGKVGVCGKCLTRYAHHEDGYIRGLS